MSDKENITENKRKTGSIFEQAAADYLVRHGYRILERNYRFRRFGEVDIIAGTDGFICFVEVKSRKNTVFGTPAEGVTPKKKKRIIFVASQYISNNANLFKDKSARFDVIEVYVDNHRNIKSMNHIENAF